MGLNFIWKSSDNLNQIKFIKLNLLFCVYLAFAFVFGPQFFSGLPKNAGILTPKSLLLNFISKFGLYMKSFFKNLYPGDVSYKCLNRFSWPTSDILWAFIIS